MGKQIVALELAEPSLDAAAGRVALGPPGVWESPDGGDAAAGRAGGEPETGDAAAGGDGGGRGRWLDTRFIERLWRSVKQEDIYPQDYGDGLMAQRGLARWFGEYNTERPHQALGYATPGEWDHAPESYGARPAAWRWQ